MSDYKLAPGTDIFDFTDRMRETLNPVRDEADLDLLIGKARKAMLGITLGLMVPEISADQPPARFLDTAYDKYMREQFDATKGTHGHDPNRFEASFFRTRSGDILVRTFAENDALNDAFDAMPEVHEYGHWSCEDIPDDITAEEWDAREAAWDEIVGRMSEHTLSFVLRASSFMRIDMQNLEPLLPAAIVRLGSWKPGLVLSDLVYRQYRWLATESGDDTSWPSVVMDCMDAVTESGAIQRVEAMLPELTPEWLLSTTVPVIERMDEVAEIVSELAQKVFQENR